MTAGCARHPAPPSRGNTCKHRGHPPARAVAEFHYTSPPSAHTQPGVCHGISCRQARADRRPRHRAFHRLRHRRLRCAAKALNSPSATRSGSRTASRHGRRVRLERSCSRWMSATTRASARLRSAAEELGRSGHRRPRRRIRSDRGHPRRVRRINDPRELPHRTRHLQLQPDCAREGRAAHDAGPQWRAAHAELSRRRALAAQLQRHGTRRKPAWRRACAFWPQIWDRKVFV